MSSVPFWEINRRRTSKGQRCLQEGDGAEIAGSKFLELSQDRAPDSDCEVVNDHQGGKLDAVIQMESRFVLAEPYFSAMVSVL